MPVVGLYVPAATHISSPNVQAPNADCKSVKASPQLVPVFAPEALAFTNQMDAEDVSERNKLNVRRRKRMIKEFGAKLPKSKSWNY